MAHVSAKHYDPVATSKILTELIRKEEAKMRLSQTFSVPDPRRLALLPAKPNATTPAAQPTEQQLAAAESVLSTLAGIKHAHQARHAAALACLEKTPGAFCSTHPNPARSRATAAAAPARCLTHKHTR
jgi:hypothetical protein